MKLKNWWIGLAKISAIKLAIRFGVIAEILLGVSFFCLGSFGPCGPTNIISGFTLMFHLPGIWLAEQLTPTSGVLFIPLALISGVTNFTIIFWVVISIWRKFRKKNSAVIENLSVKS